MNPAECLRVQGISFRTFQGMPPQYVRSCVGNSMSVRVVSMIMDAAFKLMKGFAEIPLETSRPSTIESRQKISRKPETWGLVPCSRLKTKRRELEVDETKYSNQIYQIPLEPWIRKKSRKDVTNKSDVVRSLSQELHKDNMNAIMTH